MTIRTPLATMLLLAALLVPCACPASGGTPKAKKADWGFDVRGMDTRVRPGDDFAMYAFGRWYRNASIPPGQPAVGLRIDQMQSNREKIRSVIEESVKHPDTANRRLISELYASYVDTARIERLDAAPLAADLDAVRALSGKTGVAESMGRAPASFGLSFFEPEVDVDRNEPSRYIVYLSQSGLGASRQTYLDGDLANAKLAYRKKVAERLQSVGWPDPERNAAAIVAMETRIAEASWSDPDSRDLAKINNVMTLAELEAYAPGFPWRAYLRAAGLQAASQVIVTQKSAFPALAAIFARTPLRTLKAWTAFHKIDGAAPYLSSRFRKDRGHTADQRAGRAVDVVDAALVEPVAREYMARYFPPASKTRLLDMVGLIRRAMVARIQRLDWMGPQSKAEALRKLSVLRVSIGYPDHWRDYSDLRLDAHALYANMQRIHAHDWHWQAGKLGRPVDRNEWFMAPQAVGAQSNRNRVHITFSAGLLQPPFFDPNADAAVNFGAIGGVIGHEIGHLFDDQGAKIDASGKLRAWWAPGDEARFEAKTAQLVRMLGTNEMSPGVPVDGRATLSETMANLLGEEVALDAYHASLQISAPVIDGFTGDQRFFLAFAQTWKAKARDEFWREMGNQAPPGPSVNTVVRNIDEWYAAFAVKPGDALYLAPSERVRIW